METIRRSGVGLLLAVIVGAVLLGRLIPVNEGEHIVSGPGYTCVLLDGSPSLCLAR